MHDINSIIRYDRYDIEIIDIVMFFCSPLASTGAAFFCLTNASIAVAPSVDLLGPLTT